MKKKNHRYRSADVRKGKKTEENGNEKKRTRIVVTSGITNWIRILSKKGMSENIGKAVKPEAVETAKK